MKIEKYNRKPFQIDAVQVTAANMVHVADWCLGLIMESGKGDFYIQVKVARPMNVRQTRAFEGDWVLKAGRGFKVYTDKAFKNSFVKAEEAI